MRVRLRSMRISGRFLVALIGTLTIVGGTIIASGSAPASGPSEGVPVDIPTAIEDYAGVTIEQMQVATENSIAQKAHACMVAAGWTYPDFEPRTTPEPVIRVPVAEMYLEQLTASPATEPDDPDRAAAERDCWGRAISSVENPVSEVLAWVDAETQGIYDGVGADPRVVAARATEQQCITDAGYPSVEESQQNLEGMAAAVVDRVDAGALDLPSAESELADIAAAERELWAATDRCRGRAMDVERSVAAEAESAWLSTNLDRLHAQIDRRRAAIESLVGS
jgi:hypothetical protein